MTSIRKPEKLIPPKPTTKAENPEPSDPGTNCPTTGFRKGATKGPRYIAQTDPTSNDASPSVQCSRSVIQRTKPPSAPATAARPSPEIIHSKNSGGG